MGIAEQMGRVLQRTSISVNIKERLDFSCALFGPDGALVANAPHLPVHLGAMSEAIRYQVSLLCTLHLLHTLVRKWYHCVACRLAKLCHKDSAPVCMQSQFHNPFIEADGLIGTIDQG